MTFSPTGFRICICVNHGAQYDLAVLRVVEGSATYGAQLALAVARTRRQLLQAPGMNARTTTGAACETPRPHAGLSRHLENPYHSSCERATRRSLPKSARPVNEPRPSTHPHESSNAALRTNISSATDGSSGSAFEDFNRWVTFQVLENESKHQRIGRPPIFASLSAGSHYTITPERKNFCHGQRLCGTGAARSESRPYPLAQWKTLRGLPPPRLGARAPGLKRG